MLPWVLITGSFPPLVQAPCSGMYMLKHGSHVYVFSAREIPAALEFLVPGTLSGRSIGQASLAQGGPESCNLGARGAAGPIGRLWLPRGHLRPKVLVSEPQSTAGQVSLSRGFGRLPARRGLHESSVGTLSGSPGQRQDRLSLRSSSGILMLQTNS